MRLMRAFVVCLAGISIGLSAAPCAAGENISAEKIGSEGFHTENSRSEGFQYESRGKRDPFVPLTGGSKSVATKLEDITSVEDVKVEGIATGANGRKMAVLNGEMIKEGDKVGEVELKSIGKKSITILIGGKSYNLYLPGEDGGSNIEK